MGLSRKQFATPEDADIWRSVTFRSWAASLTNQQRFAMAHYKNDGKELIGLLRQGVAWMLTESLDEAIKAAVLPEEICVYRGFAFPKKDLAFLDGAQISTSGYLSTSLLQEVAKFFTNTTSYMQDHAKFLAEITLPAQTPAAPVDLVTKTTVQDEYELLLPRDLLLEIQLISYQPSQNIHFLKMTA